MGPCGRWHHHDVVVQRTRGMLIWYFHGSYGGISEWHMSPLTRWQVPEDDITLEIANRCLQVEACYYIKVKTSIVIHQERGSEKGVSTQSHKNVKEPWANHDTQPRISVITSVKGRKQRWYYEMAGYNISGGPNRRSTVASNRGHKISLILFPSGPDRIAQSKIAMLGSRHRIRALEITDMRDFV